ncbi:NAD(P)-binding oxidoreductase [Corynebacterium falsenii]|uniref:NAD(P)-binding oxidoreductase n=1 Tax=Corynebacterium falsenii TaxID=108486 RepID=UPI001D6C7690|nr:NAD(P)-binding oxidoreductase [Corynebacterium falsenii]HJF12130.1 SDR family oxidoreductase [Corynebacterium falsenii]
MSNVIILGGHGKVALLASPKITQKGHVLTSVVRNPDHVSEVEATGAQAVVEDMQELDVDGFRRLFDGQDVVIWAAGAGGGDKERTYAIDRDAAMRAIDAAGERRFIMISYLGAGQDHGLSEDDDFYPYAQSKADADDHLKKSAAQWTILGPSRLTNDEETGAIDINPEEGDSVSRGNVAAVLAEVVGRQELTGKTVEFNSGSTPVSEALDSL